MNNFPKVLHISSGDIWAGAEVQLFTLLKTFIENPDFSVCVVLFNHGTLEQKLRECGIKVFVLDESILNGFKIITRLRSIIREQKPDLIHTHGTKENILGSAAALLSDHVSTLRTMHGALEHKPSWMQPAKHIIHTLDWLSGYFLQARIISVSDDLTKLLRRKFPAKKVRVIENGIDIAAIQKHKIINSKHSCNEQHHVRIGLVGRLVPIKRIDIFLQTAKKLLDLYPDLNADFYIYGEGPLYEELKHLSQTMGTEHIVHFEGHCDDIYKRLQGLDVMLITSDHEGLPMTLLEAMALETPVIAHAIGGIPKVLDNGSCGILCYEQSPTTYANEIYRLINSLEKRENMAHRAYHQVYKHYSANKNAYAYLCEYRSILAER